VPDIVCGNTLRSAALIYSTQCASALLREFVAKKKTWNVFDRFWLIEN
jgi:hypothetical protein